MGRALFRTDTHYPQNGTLCLAFLRNNAYLCAAKHCRCGSPAQAVDIIREKRSRMKYVFDREFGRLCKSAGIDVRRMLINAHLPEDLFGRQEIMLTMEEYYGLMESAGRMASDEAVLKIATCDGIETFSPPVFAAYCSGDGLNFLARLAHYKQLVGPLRLSVAAKDDRLELEICSITERLTVPAFWAELEMVFVLNLMRKATATDVMPLCITLQHEVHSTALADFLGCQPSCGKRNILALSPADVSRPFVSRNDGMWQFMEPELRRRLSEMEIDDTQAIRVRSALVELLPAGKATVDDLASKLCMSHRTLQRKLAEEGTTFQQLLNNTRLLLAKNYLRNTDRTNGDIAFLLGYEDTSSFLRAFRTWTGQTVKEYKKTRIR